MKFARIAAVFALLLASSAHAATVCNGAASLCAKPYDQVAYPTTHNSFANAVHGFVFNRNQTYDMTRQMQDGIRGLMLDAHPYNGTVYLCHGEDLCWLANESMADGLTEIKNFLDANPQEVVTIIFESYVTAADLAAVFQQVGLLDPAHPESDYLYEYPGGPWPTLGQMIDAGTRLVVFSDQDEQAAYPWYHYLWTSLAFETPFSVATVNDFTCANNRGTPNNDLFILNHFLTGPLGASTDLAAQANVDPLFVNRALECQSYYGRIPNYPTVDYYEIGNLFDVTATLNGTAESCIDRDGDGYGSPASDACPHPEGDCDDSNPAVNPGATEIPGNGIDDDCNAATPGGCNPQLAEAGTMGSRSVPAAASTDLGLYLVPAALAVSLARRRLVRRTG